MRKMKNYAQINSKNIVQQILVVAQDKDEAWLKSRLGGTWIETSEKIRFNLAGKGMTYDSSRDAFIPPKPFESWILNEETCHWEAPTPKPEGDFYWDEETTSWIEVTEEEN